MKDIFITNLDNDFSRSYCFREGLFASFTALLGILPTLEKYNLKPIIDPKIKHYSTPEYNYKMASLYFELNYVPEKVETLSKEFYAEFNDEFNKKLFIENDSHFLLDYQSLYCKVSGGDVYSDNPSFEEANFLFFKYYKFTSHITDKINSIVKTKFNKYILGLHYRGSDKLCDSTQNPMFLSREEYILIIENHIIENNIKDIFLATDSTAIIPYINNLKNKYNLNVIRTNSILFDDNISPFIQTSKNPIKLGTDCLIDSLLLSNCSHLILTSSNVSAWSKIFNPNLPTFKLSYFPFNWFPQHFIPYYKNDNKSITNILNRIQKINISNKI